MNHPTSFQARRTNRTEGISRVKAESGQADCQRTTESIAYYYTVSSLEGGDTSFVSYTSTDLL